MTREMVIVTLGILGFGAAGCPGKDTGDSVDTGETGDTSDSADTGETADTAETGETAETAETADTAETGDTGDTGQDCSGGELIFALQVLDASGLPCEACDAEDGVTLRASVTNPSPVDVALNFRDGCVIGTWGITDEDGVVWTEYMMCTEAEVTRTIPACGELVDSWDDPVVLDPGAYTAMAEFDDEVFTVVQAEFTLE